MVLRQEFRSLPLREVVQSLPGQSFAVVQGGRGIVQAVPVVLTEEGERAV